MLNNCRWWHLCFLSCSTVKCWSKWAVTNRIIKVVSYPCYIIVNWQASFATTCKHGKIVHAYICAEWSLHYSICPWIEDWVTASGSYWILCLTDVTTRRSWILQLATHYFLDGALQCVRIRSASNAKSKGDSRPNTRLRCRKRFCKEALRVCVHVSMFLDYLL